MLDQINGIDTWVARMERRKVDGCVGLKKKKKKKKKLPDCSEENKKKRRRSGHCPVRRRVRNRRPIRVRERERETGQSDQGKEGKEGGEFRGDRPDPQFDPRDPLVFHQFPSKFHHFSSELLQEITWELLHDLPSIHSISNLKRFGLEIG